MNDLIALWLVFAKLGLLAFGGAQGILPEMRHEIVFVNHWITDEQFAQAFAVGQLAPGPNMLMTVYIGYLVAGIPGALTVATAIFTPPAVLSAAVSHWWSGKADNPWAIAVQRGLAPVAIGLIAAGLLSLAEAALIDIRSAAFALVAFLLILSRRFNPALVILLAGFIGLFIP